MKIAKYFAATFLAILILSPTVLQGQSRFRSKHLKYVDEARTQAIAGTLVPVVLGLGTAWLVENNTIEKAASFSAVYGLVIGPSFGNFYAKDYLRGMLGVAARLGGGYLLLDATRELAGNDVADGLGWDNKSVSLTSARTLIGGGIILGSAIYNIVSSKASVNRYNEQQGYVAGIVPTVHQGKIIPMFTASINF